MRLSGESAQRYRNERIIAMQEEGKTQSQIAQLLDCSQAWVSQFLKKYRIHGTADLASLRQQRGAKCRLSMEELEQLKTYLKSGALSHGFTTDNWTQKRIVHLIEQEFGVSYHPSHVANLMAKIKFSRQQPTTHSYRKNPAEVKKWKEERLPAAKKKAQEEDYLILYADEASISVVPRISKTYAPIGETPTITVRMLKEPLYFLRFFF